MPGGFREHGVEVNGAGHCVHVERPQEFAALTERFLAGVPRRCGQRRR